MEMVQNRAVRVLIVGGGFGGRYAAQRLVRRLPAGSTITLVDRNDYLLYTPMLTEVAGRSVSPQHVQAPNRELSRRIAFVQGELASADLHKRTITLAGGQVLEADHLVFALGSTTNFRNVEGAEQHSLTMKTLDDARRARILAQRNIQLAAREGDSAKRRTLLSFVVAGGGYTGVETVAALNDLVHDTARLHGTDLQDLHVTLVESGERLMAEMPEPLATYSQQQLEQDGVRVRLGVGVAKVEPETLTLTSGDTLSAGLLVWDTGIEPNPVIADFDCAKGKRGGIATDSTFRVLKRPGVWAIGDCAEIPKPDGSGKFFETTAQNATREGAHVANNILAVVQGRPVRPFRYKQIGELAVVGRHSGVANVYGVQVKGSFAWLMWRAIYLAKMPSMGQRLALLSDWFRLAFGREYVPVTWHVQARETPGLPQRDTA